MTEKQSEKKMYDTAKLFAKKFDKADPIGVEQMRAILADRFKVAKLPDLSHEQRIEFIETLEAKMA